MHRVSGTPLPGRPFRFAQLRRLQERLLEYAEGHGYPLPRPGWRDVQVGNGKTSAPSCG